MYWGDLDGWFCLHPEGADRKWGEMPEYITRKYTVYSGKSARQKAHKKVRIFLKKLCKREHLQKEGKKCGKPLFFRAGAWYNIK